MLKSQKKLIDGVEIKQLTTHPDDRGFFREVIRTSDPFFAGAFGQWSHSMMVTGTIKAWHVHNIQTDFWYVVSGLIRAAVAIITKPEVGSSHYVKKYNQFLMGDNQPPIVLKILPGVAHGLKVLQGPAHLLYITSEEYDGSDEGRIAYDALGYDWHKEVIK